MNIKFIAHDAKSSSSCSGLVEYLNKENEIDTDKVRLQENFFNQEYSETQPLQNIEMDDVKDIIDSNRGSRKLSESNFYMLNISPSKDELIHLEKIAVAELTQRGYDKNSPVHEESKQELIKMQLKLYTKNLMSEYASNFEREVFINPDKLPSNEEKKALEMETNKIYKDYLEERGIEIKENTNPKKWKELKDLKIILENKKSLKVELNLEGFGNKEVSIPKTLLHEQKNGTYKIPQTLYDNKVNEAIEKEYGTKKESIYKGLAHQKGFDLSKRQLTGDDLLWYGKVETQRHYNHKDREVIRNKELLREIEIEKNNPEKIKELEAKLNRDPFTKEVIKHDTLKGGDNFHVHVLVSRHDKTNHNARDKISLSPLSAARDKMLLAGKNQVGFNRSAFFKTAEQTFDKKFEYTRPIHQSYEYFNYKKKNYDIEKSEKELGNKISSGVKNEAKNFIFKHTGLNEVKQQLNPIQSIKEQIPFAKIPTSFPKSITDLSIKVVRKILDSGKELGY